MASPADIVVTSPDHRRSHELIAAQKQSLELIVSGAPLAKVLEHLVTTVERLSDGASIASIMLLNADGRLHNGAAPSLPEHYLNAIDGLPADPTLGTCCAAAAIGEAVVTPDFAAAPGWRGIAHLPIALGLKGAWSMPIVARDGSVLGTFGTYFRECREPTAEERAVVDVLVRTAAIAIERERAEEVRRVQNAELVAAKNEAEAASRAKSQFLAIMSHELRTPLTGIIGYAELLATEVSGPMSEMQIAQADRIKSGAWHLVSIIDEILTFSRMEAGKETIAIELADLAKIVRESAELLQPHAASKGVDLRVRTATPAVPIETDPGKVRQIVLNLMGNALKFTEHGFVELSVQEAGDNVRVEVRDTGCGIPSEKRDEIFEPFAQVDQSHTRLVGGTGLGLTVSRHLARLLGGDVRVEKTQTGGGSTFVVVLPRNAHLPSANSPVTAIPSLHPAALPASRESHTLM